MLQVNFYPFPLLKTEHCILRKIEQEDAPEILFLRSDKHIMRYLDREPMTSFEEAQIFISKIDESLSIGNGISWGICLGDNPKLIGKIGLWRIIKEHHRAEIGYALHPHLWEKGIMSEVLKEVIRYGFDELKLHSIEANVNPKNEASIKLLERQNFVREAYFKENYYYKGIFLDSAIYSLIAPE